MFTLLSFLNILGVNSLFLISQIEFMCNHLKNLNFEQIMNQFNRRILKRYAYLIMISCWLRCNIHWFIFTRRIFQQVMYIDEENGICFLLVFILLIYVFMRFQNLKFQQSYSLMAHLITLSDQTEQQNCAYQS